MTRADWIRRLVVAGFIAPLFFVWKFFVGERFYAHVPLHPAMGELPTWVDGTCFLLIILSLLASFIWVRSRRALGFFLVLSLLFSLWDQSRWMPYFYQFYFMFVALYAVSIPSPSEEQQEQTFNTLRCIVLGIWFWSGLHKISAAYVAIGYPWMVHPLLRFVPADYHQWFLSSSFLSPIIESGGALCLLFPRTRPLGLLTICGMHLTILLIFGPLGLNWNPSVWSWNLVMIGFVILLFLRSKARPAQILFGTAKNRGDKVVHRVIATMFIVMPFFNFFGYWDDFLSHCLYSWTTREAEILVPAEAESILPEEVRRNVKHDKVPGVVPVLDWSFSVFESPPYHSYRVFYAVFGKLCEYTQGDQRLTFKMYGKPEIRTAHTSVDSYKCAPALGPREIVEVEHLP